MPARPSHIPHNLGDHLAKNECERGAASETTLSGEPGDTRRNVAKGWIEKQMDANRGSRYRITLAGEAALKAKFQTAARELIQSSRNPVC